jgi:hypothetical protein
MSKPNRLQGSFAYLCGAMDRVADGGVIWRAEITPILKKLGVVVLDPVHKPLDCAREDFDNRVLRRKYKQEGNYDKVAEFVKEIRHVDLRMVDTADFLIVSLDLDAYPCGTWEELFWANRQKKPILVWVPQGKKEAPDWLFGTIPHQMIFSSMKSIIQYLEEVDGGEDPETYGRWIFFKPRV